MTTSTYRIESFKQFSDDGLIVLITIDHKDLTEPVRLAWYPEQVISRGNTYSPFPFTSIELPKAGERNPRVRLVTGGPALDLVPYIRDLDDPLDVTIELVRINDPDTVEESFDNLVSTQFTITDVISMDLRPADDLERSFPKDSIDPANFPGSHP